MNPKLLNLCTVTLGTDVEIVNENLIQINGDDLVESLKKVPKGSPIGFEKVLIKTKTFLL